MLNRRQAIIASILAATAAIIPKSPWKKTWITTELGSVFEGRADVHVGHDCGRVGPYPRFDEISGWNPSKRQFLCHDGNRNLKWFDIKNA